MLRGLQKALASIFNCRDDKAVNIELDRAKSGKNERKRGNSFSLAEWFEWETSIVVPDDRRDYGELRFRAIGLIDGKPHALVFTPRGQGIRVISLRWATRREDKKYAETSQS